MDTVHIFNQVCFIVNGTYDDFTQPIINTSDTTHDTEVMWSGGRPIHSAGTNLAPKFGLRGPNLESKSRPGWPHDNL